MPPCFYKIIPKNFLNHLFSCFKFSPYIILISEILIILLIKSIDTLLIFLLDSIEHCNKQFTDKFSIKHSLNVGWCYDLVFSPKIIFFSNLIYYTYKMTTISSIPQFLLV